MMKESDGDPNPYLHMKKSNGVIAECPFFPPFFSIVVFMDPSSESKLAIFCPKKTLLQSYGIKMFSKYKIFIKIKNHFNKF